MKSRNQIWCWDYMSMDADIRGDQPNQLKTKILNASMSGLISKRNRLKFLALHSTFCLIDSENTQIEWPSWLLWNLLLFMKLQSDALQNGDFNIKNVKSRVKSQQIPLSLRCDKHSFSVWFNLTSVLDKKRQHHNRNARLSLSLQQTCISLQNNAG